ncbi:protein-cysteine N-palmitoyltransferase Rasp isoform X1 [Diorhabda sublineata]|uniref:protein-cysteine N-palmitoyltransferase Rasp isoform X1 n=1 Tax=Diorhabda sublineata TaxID=1163346 RepID=UPI0024E0DC2F|nr:protein-cysteine N-palmitoyltransferase Rasp isoform X1 [Diorhabda sublineata]XP_056633001.1 protein-cysteine N-palmitoyltransferase Rasp isoform X1 [Diorhabda sublineata]
MNFELVVYFFGWTLSVIYSVYCFSFNSFQYFIYYEDIYNDFTDDLSFLPKRDKSDLEWELIVFMMKQYFLWIAVYLIFSYFIKKRIKHLQVLQLWQILFTTTYILIKWNYVFLFLILLQPMVFHICSHFKYRIYSVWITSGFFLIFLNYFKSTVTGDSIVFHLLNVEDFELYILISSLFWINLRCISFYLETDQNYNLLDVLSYCLYPPTVLTGPFILYNEYQANYYFKEVYLVKFKQFCKNICRTIIWYIFCHICLHFVYVSATGFHPQMIKRFNSWSLYGYGYAMGQFFHLKYVVLYGMSTSFASFEDIKVPCLPRCIGRIHLYSEMWKFFDPGLYNFLIKNIYLPLTNITTSKPIRSFICFSFVYVWHGLDIHILIWALLNYSGLMIEDFLWPKKVNEKIIVYKQSWKRRKDCFIAAFLLGLSAISNFYFFAGADVGHLFFERIFSDYYGNVILIVALYCCCQISYELKFLPANKM